MRIDRTAAEKNLTSAFALSEDVAALPPDWLDFAEFVFGMSAKTYAAAMITALLAKSVEPSVDLLSIKEKYSNSAYSLRSLAHSVVVPMSRSLGFSIGTTGREPINNQPFFRYDHMSEMGRVRDVEANEKFVDGLSLGNALDSESALVALAAGLYVARNHLPEPTILTIEATKYTLTSVLSAVRWFLREGSVERPRRLQAFGAAVLDMGHSDVRSRRLNDPSRDVPGDVQVYDQNEIPTLAMEVRGKKVSISDYEGFVAECRRRGIRRAIVFVDSVSHKPLVGVTPGSLGEGEQLTGIFESAESLFYGALTWTDADLVVAMEHLVNRVLFRLAEIEAPGEVIEE